MQQLKTDYDLDLLWLHKGSSFMVAGDVPIRLPIYNRKANGWYLNILPDGRYEAVHADEQLSALVTPSVLLQAPIVTLGEKTEEGECVKSVRETWREIARQVQSQSDFLFEFTTASRAFELFLAATYRMDGFDEVIVTPHSNDRGRDVIAQRKGNRSVRILEQAKAYRECNLVTHQEVRAMIGVMAIERYAYSGSITTTSNFAPTICNGDEFEAFVPEKLTLRNGAQLRDWLLSLISTNEVESE
ncbi:MAG: restriction endonuclease [Planctomycetota bacterium]